MPAVIMGPEGYQITQRCLAGRTMGVPAAHWKAFWNSGMFESGPITRYLPVGCGSPWIIVRWVSGRMKSPRNCPQEMKNCCLGVKPVMRS